MEELIRALTARLTSSTLPLYLADAVPENAAFPYLTAEVVSPFRMGEPGSIRLTLWCTGPNGNLARMVLHTTLTQYFPGRGLVLQGDNGRYVLRSEAAQCVQSGDARGICTPMEVRFYPAAKEAETA